MKLLLGPLKPKIILFVYVFCLIHRAEATEYYISANGNDKNPGTIEQPWRTITKANQQLQCGDIVYLRKGRYSQSIYPEQNGKEHAFITYTAYPSEIAVIHSRPNGAILSGKSYITIQGIHFENCNYFVRSYPAGFDHCIIKDCVMQKQTGWCGIEIGDGSSYNKIINNVINSSGVEGDCIHIGKDDFGEKFGAQYNLVENNECFGALHGGICCAGDKTEFNMIRNNYIHDIGDNAIATGAMAKWTLIERNRIYNPGTDKDGASAMQIRSENNIIRYNIMYRDLDQEIDNGAAAIVLQSTAQLPYVRTNTIYHNVIYNFNQSNTHWHGIQLAVFNRDVQFGPNIFKNNIIYKNGIDNDNSSQIAYTRTVDSMPNDVFDGNLICGKKPGSKVIYFFEYQRQQLTLNEATKKFPGTFLSMNIDASPLFVDEENHDFRLQSLSPCIDAGVHLTVANSSGNGNQVPVKDAQYFCDGWGICEGDIIKISGNQVVRIIAVDYANNVITVDKNVSWELNDSVSLNNNGHAPDIGAYEFFESGDTLAPFPPQDVKVIFP